MTEVHLSGGLPETILPEDPAAAALSGLSERAAVATIVARYPRSLEGWATLGDLARDDVEAYACYRVGYHRGLDALRANGWRGSGFVRWEHPSNRGFLRSLAGLERVATAIGEADEASRCHTFLHQLDPRTGQ